MTIRPHSIIHGLSKVTWRLLEAPPYDVAGFDFSHSHGESRSPFVDGARHDWMGLDPIPMKFQFYFLNSLRKDAFPTLWESWRKALFDGSPGPLQHPLLGAVDAVVKDGSVDLKAQTTAGIIVSVNFTKTELDAAPSKFEGLEVSASDLASHADTAMQDLGIAYPDGMPYSSLSEFLLAILAIPSLYQTALLGKINQAKGFIDKIVDSVGTLTSPDAVTWPVTALLKSLWLALHDMAAQAGAGARPTTSVAYPYPTTFDEVAANTGNTVVDLLGLNVDLARSPIIKSGAAVRYYS